MPDSVKSKIGEIIHGYKVTAQYKDEIILAEAVTLTNPDRAVVWRLDYQGEPYSGGYFDNVLSAQREFIKRAFGMVIL